MSQNQIEPLVTECPGCHTRFRVSEAQLQRARGRVRCGACLHVFDGVDRLTPESLSWQADQEQVRLDLDALLDELGASAFPGPAPRPTAERRAHAVERAPLFGGYEEPERVPIGENAAPARDGSILHQIDGAHLVQGGAPSAASAGDAAFNFNLLPERLPAIAEEAPASNPEKAPASKLDEAPAAKPRSVQLPNLDATQRLAERERLAFGEPRSRRRWLWVVVPILMLLLAAQVLWYRFDDWSKQPQLRGVYEVACRALGCELPVRRDTNLLSTRNLAVRSDPEQPGLLLVDAVIVNEADFAQPFPMLELRFTTLRDILVAGRRYQPVDYLLGDAAGLTLIPPKTPIRVELKIPDPGPEAVNYFLRLR